MRKSLSIAVGLALVSLAEGAHADNVATRWVGRAFNAVRAANTSTPRAGRNYAMVTVAMYDAVNGIDREAGASTRTHALVPPEGASASGDRRAAVSGAAHAVLVALFPTQTQSFDSALAAELALLSDADPSDVESGRNWGKNVGQEVVARRSADGTQMAETQPGGTGAGVFPRPFTNAQFRKMAPFGVVSVDRYASAGPPALTSEAYATDVNEVKAIGSIDDENPERTHIMRHWQAEDRTLRETGLWLKAALKIIDDQETDESLADTVRLLALLGMANGDAVTTSWKDKFHYHFWRPADAIRNASTDENPDTEEDRDWMPRNIGVGGTPEHTSGTSTFAGAAATILAGFYCRGDIAFSFQGEGGTIRSYSGFKEAAREAGRSRIYGGIHFQFSNDAGREAGKALAKEILRTRLVPEGACPGATCVCLPK